MKDTLGHQKLRKHLSQERTRGRTQTHLAEDISRVLKRTIKQGYISRYANNAMPSGNIIAALQVLGIAEPLDWCVPAVDESGTLPTSPDAEGAPRPTGTDE